ncbi:MAG: hypothetical protein ABI981_11240 [Betaproteobacteria bacterium]
MSAVLRIPRRVEQEMLDVLPQTDPRAMRSRLDLRRINRVMATQSLLCGAIDKALQGGAPRSLVELGAGDGTLLLRLARRRAARWPGVAVTLVDRQDLVTEQTRRGFAAIGWSTRVIVAEVLAWIGNEASSPCDLFVANLFLHHFQGPALASLLAQIAQRSNAFVACEPRRGAVALVGSHLIGLLGCNAVSRNDAVSSVHAGFRDRELTSAWPQDRGWRLDEYRGGLFSHCFVAARFAHAHGSRNR